MQLIDKDFLHSQIGHIVLESYINNGGCPTQEDVEKHLEARTVLTPEMRSHIGPMVATWVQHFERKKNEYVQKSKCVNWLTDVTYDLEVR